MHSGLILHSPVNPVSIGRQLEHNLLVASRSTRSLVRNLKFPALALGIFRIHPEQVTCENRRLVTTSTSTDLHHRILTVIRIGRNQQQLDILLHFRNLRLYLGNLLTSHLAQILILLIGHDILGRSKLLHHLLVLETRLDNRLKLLVILVQLHKLLHVRHHCRIRQLSLESLVFILKAKHLLKQRIIICHNYLKSAARPLKLFTLHETLHIAAAPHIELMVIFAPDVYRPVRLNLRIRYRPQRSALLVFVRHRTMENRAHTLVLPLRNCAVQHQVNRLVIVHRLQEMEPAEREQLALRLLQSLGHERESNPERHQFILLIQHYAAHLVVDERHAHLRLMLYLLVRERDEIVHGGNETFIVHLEEILHQSLVLLELRQTPLMEIVPLLQHSGNPCHLVRTPLIRNHLVLKPVAFLLIAEGSDEVIVIRIVVQAVERRDVLIALNEHSLLAQSVVIQRPVNLCHPVLLRPCLGRFQQEARHFDIIDSIEPAEPRPLLGIQLVISRIDHAADPSHDLLPVHRKPHLVSAIIQSRVLRQALDLVHMKRRNILGTIPVQFIRKLYELLQFLAGSDLYDSVTRFIFRHTLCISVQYNVDP